MASLLEDGIKAAKARDFEQARRLLTQLVESDETNEQAWLWLSGVVETNEERCICLKNVLTLNPDNKVAQRGLEKLKDLATPTISASSQDKVLHQRELTPVSPAAAILYPERQVVQWEETVADTPHRHEIEYQSHTDYDDVWSREEDICAFCAHLVAYDDEKCTGCQRRLTGWRYRYDKPGIRLYFLYMMMLSLGIVTLIDGLLRFLADVPFYTGLIRLMLAALFFVLSSGVYHRQLWGHVGTIALGVVNLFVSGNEIRVLIAEGDTLGRTIINAFISIVGAMADLSILTSLSGLFTGILLLTSTVSFLIGVLALVYAVFLVGPDFDKVKTRFIAKVEKAAADPSAYFLIGKEYAERGMWATAIIHWQYAVGNEPHRAQYQRLLGEAYARLGFYQRSLDMLKSAHHYTGSEQVRSEIAQLIEAVRQQQASAV